MSVYTRLNKQKEPVWFYDFIWKNHLTGEQKRIRRPAKDPYQRPARSRTAAEQAEQRFRAELLSAPVEAPKPLIEGTSLATFFERFLVEYVSRNKPSSRHGTKTVFRIHLLPALGSMSVDEIDESDLARLASELREKGLSPKTINNVLTNLNVCLSTAHTWGVRKNQPPKVKWEKNIDEEIEHFGTEDINKLLKLQDPLITVALKTGLRIGELLALKWSDIRDKKITVSRSVWWMDGTPHDGATKSNRIRVVPLPPSALEALDSIGRLSEFVFTGNEGERLSRNDVRPRLWTACEEVGLKTCGFHKLRHSYISELVRLGVPLPQVQKLAGHSDIKMTMRYTHVHNDDLVSAVSKLT